MNRNWTSATPWALAAPKVYRSVDLLSVVHLALSGEMLTWRDADSTLCCLTPLHPEQPAMTPLS